MDIYSPSYGHLEFKGFFLYHNAISTNYKCYKKLRLAAVMAVAATELTAAMVGGGYNVGSYTMVACSALYKQLCWEFGVSHNCVCIISEGPLMYVMTCLKKLFSPLILNLVIRFVLNLLVTAIAPASGASNWRLYLEIDLKTLARRFICS